MDAPLKRTKAALFIALAGLLALGFSLSPFAADQALLASPTATRRPHNTPEPPPTIVFTATPSVTPTLISGVLSCDTVAPGVTCTNYGTYLDYNINIVVTGLTGGATAYNIFIATFMRGAPRRRDGYDVRLHSFRDLGVWGEHAPFDGAHYAVGRGAYGLCRLHRRTGLRCFGSQPNGRVEVCGRGRQRHKVA